MLLRANDNDLAVELRGPVEGVPVILLADADTPASRWPAALTDLLVEADFRVVTFDYRDCGASSQSTDEYTLVDLAADVLIIRAELVAVGELVDRPMHLLGHGMGGTIALFVALAQPAAVDSLVLIGSTPGRTDESLPDPHEDLVAAMADRHFRPAPQTREDKIAWLVEQAQLFAGERYPFDEWEVVAAAAIEAERAWRPESGHGNAVVSTDSVRELLPEIGARVLILHGTEDQVFPLDHAHSLVDGLPAADLLVVEGLGHEFPAGLVGEFGDQIVAYLTQTGR